ncbi:hypothetical protein OS493_008606 [Desmophyllum pertusum]|uniref:Potassium channel tetramerisation-type BTB domain-containing protein n=1 Tax=Desmophyllum pertusum TaxID=174260 RepID=A0A9X0D6B0_9CNID|nr:hypothetical protein OS493_008606 [Desmophyllum pertusum]
MAAKQEQDLSLFELASAKLSDAQKLMTEARDLLKQDLSNARQEKEAIEEITKTLKDVHFASSIKLNVGGKVYKTTLDTLRKDPDSMLCAMFSGRFELKADEDDGAYFIDRDTELFSSRLFCDTKYDPEIEASEQKLEAMAANVPPDQAQFVVVDFSASRTSSTVNPDLNTLVTAVTFGKAQSGWPNEKSMNKAPSSVKVDAKTAAGVHPYTTANRPNSRTGPL